MIDHDVSPGPLTRCQISGSPNLLSVIDLGAQPLCDALLSYPNEPETHYPLALNYCPDSGLAQLSYVVDGATVYPADYPYRSGISKPLREYQQAFADGVVARKFAVAMHPLVVDVGSNDGTLLTGFRTHGWRILGVEPTAVADLAESDNGVQTIRSFFNEETARHIVREFGHAAVVTMTNVFAHMATLGTVMRALVTLLSRDGVFITESHYLLDVLAKLQFDTIYHEHVRTYTLRSIQCLVEQYGLEVFAVERGTRYGGNIRAYVARAGVHPIEESVRALRREEDAALSSPKEVFRLWRSRVEALRRDTMEYLYTLQRNGSRIVGCSAPGRASTLMNYYGIDRSLIPYTAELPTSLKLGKIIPGARIPIVRNDILRREHPDYIMLFSWHYADAISTRLRAEGIRSKFIRPLPRLEVMHPSLHSYDPGGCAPPVYSDQ